MEMEFVKVNRLMFEEVWPEVEDGGSADGDVFKRRLGRELAQMKKGNNGGLRGALILLLVK